MDEGVLRQYFGGRGLGAKILWDQLGERWESVDPLGPENILLALIGPLTGYYPGGRVCITGKSPQSNGIIGSTVGGEFAVELKCAGYDGIIVKGRASSPAYLFIKDDEAELRDAQQVWGRDGKQTVRLLTKEVREDLRKRHPLHGEWREPGILYIGPAGENKARPAAVMQKWTHAAGYGGYGAVMGSKNLKAIVVKGTGPLPEVKDMEKVKTLMNIETKRLLTHDGTRRWGTGAGGYETGAGTSSEPVRNWQEEWHDERGFGVDKFERRVWVKRYWGCYWCPLTCLKVSAVRTGPFKGAITDNPDYENQAYAGTNLGVFQPEGNVYVMSAIDEMGFCGIQGGNVLGFAAELYQRGILTKEDLGMELNWGDAKAFATLAHMIARREGVGDLLAEGTYRAALKISKIKGVEITKYAVQEKGVAIGAHGMRSGLEGWIQPIAYACSVQAGDHTSVASLVKEEEVGGELGMAFLDSAVTCSFCGPGEAVRWTFVEAVTGWNITTEEWNSIMGRRILHIQRAALLLGGTDLKWSTPTDDDNPPRFYEPLPSGPKKGQSTDRAKFEELRQKYYKAIGWDERGIPKTEVLAQLGLENVDKALAKIR